MHQKYNDLDIHFSIGSYSFYALNIVFETFLRSIPLHSHSRNSYEIHYIPTGHGHTKVNNIDFDIIPNTLYITGPYVRHAQTTDLSNPMSEYCIYLNMEKKYANKLSSQEDKFMTLFENTSFWYGQDTQSIHPILQNIFHELEQQKTGYMTTVETLLQQLIIKLIRNYEESTSIPSSHTPGSTLLATKNGFKSHFEPANLVDSKYIIIEESFLYDYSTLTLDMLASRLGLGKRQTERLLKDHYNKTFLQKKSEAKMSAALLLLSDSTQSITSISELLGYSSVEHFSSAFKHYYHKSANAYRRELKTKTTLSK